MAETTALLETRDSLVRRGKRLEYFTILYNSLEGIVGVVAGLIAGSIALVGFGIDSGIEVTSGVVLLWRMLADADHERRERVEAMALRIVGLCFLGLAAYITYDAITSLLHKQAPARSVVGIALAIASLVVMPLLSHAKRAVARQLHSSAMHADARQTEFCTYLSAILLGGLLLNAVLGWWWADAIAGLAMMPLITAEGVDALRGKSCCD